jgi:hypothetical protein
MPHTPRVSSAGWMVLFLGIGLVAWWGIPRIQRINQVSSLGPQNLIRDSSSLTGYQGGRRWQIIPERNLRSFQWIRDTQQMFAAGEMRIRHVQADNAPLGRITYSPSPYRWWLGLVAWSDHTINHNPFGIAVERAALVANPLLQIMLLILGTAMVARWFGPTAAILFSLGLVTLFPLATVFLPGAPDSRALSLIVSLLSLLPLIREPPGGPSTSSAEADRSAERRFVVGGILGGIGLWLDLVGQGTLIIGLALGGALQGAIRRDRRTPDIVYDQRWACWGLSGAITSLACYLVEYFPGHLDWRPEVNHPIYGLAWLGLGLLLAQWEARGPRIFRPRGGREAIFLLFGVLSLAALPFWLWFTERFPGSDPLVDQLANLPGILPADNFGAWVGKSGLDSNVLATCAPLLAIIPVWLAIGPRSRPQPRLGTFLLGLGPVVTTFALACFQLEKWSSVDLTILSLVITAAATTSPQKSSNSVRLWSIGCVAIVVVCGCIRLVPPGRQGNLELSRREVIALIERDLAYWIADRSAAENGVILAPPYCSVGLAYFGGLRGLGSPSWENPEGMASALQIATSTRSEEALGRLAQREVTHLVLPTWDQDLDELVKWTMPTPDASLLFIIRQGSIPPWLTPLAYSPPTVMGLENPSVLVLRVDEENDSPAALIARAEYYLELNQLDLAGVTGAALKAFPSDFGALASRAKIAKARGDGIEFTALVENVVSQLEANPRASIPWDHRVSLATVLALAGNPEYARDQLKICLDGITEQRIRALNTRALYHLLVLMKTYRQNFPSPEMRAQALSLLPEELRLKF